MFASILGSDQRYIQIFASGHCTLVSKKETLDELGEDGYSLGAWRWRVEGDGGERRLRVDMNEGIGAREDKGFVGTRGERGRREENAAMGRVEGSGCKWEGK
ncbi:hypothetical protein MRB53_007118 [Persea americana]|uniref:Uncharacterized protein n=1 Tax=Persea americana TaxID=3435 RepID=A0ACC2MI39_PERAE|nr:hypothetical protein MRB53_007118 [Persea americana]